MSTGNPKAATKKKQPAAKTKTTPKPKADWERIESEYRAGLLSVREIAAAHGITHTAINKKAKLNEWTRDLSAQIKAKADALVSKREVSAEVSAQRAENDKAIIEANAKVIADVRLSHRNDIRRGRTLVMTLLEELEIQTGDMDELRTLGELLRSEDDKGVDKLNDLYHKVISHGSRVSSMKNLADALKNLIALEREAYNINDDYGDGKSNRTPEQVTKRLAQLLSKASG